MEVEGGCAILRSARALTNEEKKLRRRTILDVRFQRNLSIAPRSSGDVVAHASPATFLAASRRARQPTSLSAVSDEAGQAFQ